MPSEFVCPHCKDTGCVSLPVRRSGHRTLLGHGRGCRCVECLHAGAHRWYFVELPEGEKPSDWKPYRAVYACRFCLQGERFAAWSRTAMQGDGPHKFQPARRGPNGLAVTAEERDRIAGGVGWDRENPVPGRAESPVRPFRPRPVDPDPQLFAPMDGDDLAARKAELRRQAEALGAVEEGAVA